MLTRQIYIIGNWKCNKNKEDVKNWFLNLKDAKSLSAKKSTIEAIVCPVALHISLSKNLIEKYNLPVKLGAQDVSPFENGAYTGEISASQLKDFVDYTIIGHSERRKYFYEDDSLLEKKVKMAEKVGLKSIFCVQNENTPIPSGVSMIAYEPVFAIGTGKTDSPQNADRVISEIKKRHPGRPVLYGGSIAPENILSFISKDTIDGVLIGASSLDAQKFTQMISLANTL